MLQLALVDAAAAVFLLQRAQASLFRLCSVQAPVL